MAKRSPQDSTLRNVRAANKRIDQLIRRVERVEAALKKARRA